MKYRNPIIPGYHPDPSICHVGEDFYIVNSTFEFFPGVPVFHSRNLVNWEQIGYVLDRRTQLELEGCRNSGGIYAPTIRYHEGMYYMITTNVTWKGNFVVHSEKPEGPWSEPMWIDQNGIDPSLFWDDDGTCYYCSTGNNDGLRGIWAFAIDPMTGERLSEKYMISTGCGGPCTEGPHIYKVNGKYYLMCAEGGTEYQHHEVILRSDRVFGPYEPCPYGPILSHAALKHYQIQATGHADLVEDQFGNWWAVFLGIRNYSHAMLHNLGRETFLAPVTWSRDGWPVVGENGVAALEMDAPLPAPVEPVCHDVHCDFGKDEIPVCFEYTRNPNPACYLRDRAAGTLTLIGTDTLLSQPACAPTMLSVQQPDFCTHTEAVLDLASDAARAGISAFYNNDYHYDIYIANDRDLGRKYIGFTKAVHDMTVELARIPAPVSGRVRLMIDTDREQYTFSVQEEGLAPVRLGVGSNAGLSTEGTRTMTFTGTMIAMFAEQGKGIFRSFDLEVRPDPLADVDIL